MKLFKNWKEKRSHESRAQLCFVVEITDIQTGKLEKRPVYRTYRSSECSWAAFYIKSINIFRYFLPILIIFLTDGLWKKTNAFREVPDVSVTGDFIVYAFGYERSIISSSYSVLNSAASPDQLSTSQILHHFSDSNSENSALYQKPNRNLNIQFQMSTQNLSINTVIYAFSLKMKLDYHSIIDSELFLTDTIQLPSFPTSQIQTTARLTVDQSVPFQSREKSLLIIFNRSVCLFICCMS
ncbi:hypothetical protein CRE_17636 [Caenorhabditis remanei]|uniref:Transmembrane protein 231 n=1 Tax=Caenorhabditis remanei TaxID=31234 RepID=E3NJP8_CAERE|nr:hypothetical protein CRE_17636 [Caenorhabditis remanei]